MSSLQTKPKIVSVPCGMTSSFVCCFLFFSAVCCSKEIRFYLIGLGSFGIPTAQIAIKKGFKMVAAFTRSSHHDHTVGKVLEMEDDESLSFNVSPISDLEKVVEERTPRFCIDATTALLESVLPHFSRLLSMGVHIVTMAGEAMFPDTKYTLETYQIWKTFDQMAKDNGAIVVGGAYPDGVIS